VGVRFSEDAVVVATNDQVSCELGGEAAILHMQRGVYYGLDSIGAAVWKRIQQPARVADLRDFLIGEYDVERTQCETDLTELLEKLSAEGLVRLVVAESSPLEAGPAGSPDRNTSK
jgi:hypothetical protein